MNVYDFDKTIYRKDSTLQFYKFCLKKDFFILRFLPKQGFCFVLWQVNVIEKETFKGVFYSFLKGLEDVEQLVQSFWDEEIKHIEPWYLSQQEKTDVVISASPEFLLAPVCQRLGIEVLLASKVNKRTGELESPNCYGVEKVRRFRAVFPEAPVAAFYSDSLSDQPMGAIADKFYLVEKGRQKRWPI